MYMYDHVCAVYSSFGPCRLIKVPTWKQCVGPVRPDYGSDVQVRVMQYGPSRQLHRQVVSLHGCKQSRCRKCTGVCFCTFAMAWTVVCTSVEERIPEPCRFQRLYILSPTTSCLPVFTSQEWLCSLLVHMLSPALLDHRSLAGSTCAFTQI